MLREVARGAPGTLWRRIYSVPSPDAGNNVTFAVPQHKAWQLLGVAATFTASAQAGNRRPALYLFDASGVPLGVIASPTVITAGLAPTASWVLGLGAANVVAATYASMPLPDPWYMLPGESLVLTGTTDAGDTWTNVRVTVLETNTGDPAFIAAGEQRIRDHAREIHELVRGH